MPQSPEVKAVQEYIASTDSDVFIFRAAIYRKQADAFVELISKAKRRQKASVFLTTFGGDAHDAYRMARAMRWHYKQIRVILAGPCKSAGTLFAIGADEIAFAPTGELGPLDIQVNKPDDIIISGSVLDVFSALTIVENHTWQIFSEYFLRLAQMRMSTRAASEIAAKLTTAVIKPLCAQIEPLRVAEAQRAIGITKQYGERLSTPNLRDNKSELLDELIWGYPSHGFVIDVYEADRYFRRVDKLSEREQQLVAMFKGVVRYPSSGKNDPEVISDLGEKYKGEADVEPAVPGRGVEDIAARPGRGAGAEGPVVSGQVDTATATQHARPARAAKTKIAAAPTAPDGH